MKKGTSTTSRGSLYGSLLRMTLFPMLGLSLVIAVFSTMAYTSGMQKQVEQGLKSVGISVLEAYDNLYEGDFNLRGNEQDGMLLYRGDNLISGNTALIDAISEATGNEISVFFYDMRLLTTIRNSDGERCINTIANKKIREKVLEGRKTFFFDNVKINNKRYLAYYIPFFGSDGTCTGMIAVAKTTKDVNALVNKSIHLVIIITFFLMALTSVLILRFGKTLIIAIRQIMIFLSEMSKGNLSAKLNPSVLNRTDELGEMGRLTDHVQGSLRKLIERDALTGLLNRRSGEIKLTERFKKSSISGEKYSLAIGDIDFFKKVNDTYGHEAGDLVLKEMARILNDSIVGNGFAARWGGEEFLLVFDGIDEKEAEQCLNEILIKVRQATVLCDSREIKVTMTFGVTRGGVEESMNSELSRADRKLYFGKENGRNRVVSED